MVRQPLSLYSVAMLALVVFLGLVAQSVPTDVAAPAYGAALLPLLDLVRF